MTGLTIRASSLPELFDCPARWEGKYLRGLRLPSSPAAALGRAVHAGTAAYDAGRISGDEITLDDAAGVVADAIHKPDDDVDWADESPQTAEDIGIALTGLYCRQIAPGMDYVAVEAGCDRLEITDLGLALTGTVDRVARSDDGLSVVDIKTGKSAVGADGAVKTAGHAAQIAVYELLAEQAIGQPITDAAAIVGLQVAKTDKGRRAGVGRITGGRDLLLGDDGAPGLLECAAATIRSGLFPGNPRSKLCGPKYCPAHTICKWRL